MRSNTVVMKKELSRTCEIRSAHAGHISDSDWLVELFFCNVIGESHVWNVVGVEATAHRQTGINA